MQVPNVFSAIFSCYGAPKSLDSLHKLIFASRLHFTTHKLFQLRSGVLAGVGHQLMPFSIRNAFAMRDVYYPACIDDYRDTPPLRMGEASDQVSGYTR